MRRTWLALAARVGLVLGALSLLTVFSVEPRQALAADDVPPEIAALLPSAAALDAGLSSWGVLETEFGKTFNADLRAKFSGYSLSCDYTIGPELTIEIKGDTAWEEPPMLDMAVQMFESEVAEAPASVAGEMERLRSTNSDVRSVGAAQSEQLAGGHIVAVEYSEDCARHQNGTNTIVRGFKRKGATMLSLRLWISADQTAAKAMVVEIFEKFQQVDFAALTDGD